MAYGAFDETVCTAPVGPKGEPSLCSECLSRCNHAEGGGTLPVVMVCQSYSASYAGGSLKFGLLMIILSEMPDTRCTTNITQIFTQLSFTLLSLSFLRPDWQFDLICLGTVTCTYIFCFLHDALQI